MNNDLNNILSGNGRLSDELLQRYLENNLTEEERHEVEKAMLEDPMLEEAMEGLSGKSTPEVQGAVHDINKELRKHIAKRSRLRKRKGISDQSVTYYAIILILLLCVIAYLLVKKSA
jgi:hypothetical protein